MAQRSARYNGRHGPCGRAGLSGQALARQDFEGTQVAVASPEDLIVTKVLAGRAKDIEDVRAIAAAQGARLDFEYARHTIEALEHALGQSDLMPLFEDATRLDE